MDRLATLAHLATRDISPTHDLIQTSAGGRNTGGQSIKNLAGTRGNVANLAPPVSNLEHESVGLIQTMEHMPVTFGSSLEAVLQPSNTFAPSHSARPTSGVQDSTLGFQAPTTNPQGRTFIPPSMTVDSRVQYGHSRSIHEQSTDPIVPRPGTPFPHILPPSFPHQQGGTTITTSRPVNKPATRGSRPRIVTRAHPSAKWTTPNGTVAFNTLPGAEKQSSLNDVRDSSQNKHMQEPFKDSRSLQDTVEQPTGPSNKIATDGFQPIIILSPQRGNLYTRRKSKSPSKSPQNRYNIVPPRESDTSSDTIEDVPPEHEFDFNGFNIFKALLNHAELVFEMISYLEVGDLISLYAISKDFHYLVNSRFNTMIKDQAMIRAPESADVFRFKCYKHLCQFDPAKRENKDIKDRVRDIPSFRWLSMITYREQTVTEIIHLLAAEGHHLPKKTSIAIKKIWFTMDICDSSRRVGLTHNRKFWTDSDLTLATMFFMKLDMRFTDPLDGNGDIGLRKMMMAQRGMGPLMQLLRHEYIENSYEMLQAYVEWRHVPLREHRGMAICGIPPTRVGRLSREGWGRGTLRLIGPDEAIMMEEIRRGLGLRERYKDMLLFGYVDPRTFQSIPAKRVLEVYDAEWEEADESVNKDVEKEGQKGIDQEDLQLYA